MRRFLWDRFPLAAAVAGAIPTASMVHLAGIALGRPASGRITTTNGWIASHHDDRILTSYVRPITCRIAFTSSCR